MTGSVENIVTPEALTDAALEVKRYLGFLSDLGCSGFDCSAESLARVNSWDKPKIIKTAQVHTAQTLPDVATIEAVRSNLGECGRCALAGSRRHLVFGQGNPRARLMLIGDVPDPDEDRQGRLFLGEAGQLLARMIGAMGLSPESVYHTTLLKCRPADGQKPQPREVAACLPVLERQIRAVNPEVICTLGAVATQALLGQAQGVAQLRGSVCAYGNWPVIPTFHPAYLLKHPENKRDSWEDLKKIMARLGLERQP